MMLLKQERTVLRKAERVVEVPEDLTALLRLYLDDDDELSLNNNEREACIEYLDGLEETWKISPGISLKFVEKEDEPSFGEDKFEEFIDEGVK